MYLSIVFIPITISWRWSHSAIGCSVWVCVLVFNFSFLFRLYLSSTLSVTSVICRSFASVLCTDKILIWVRPPCFRSACWYKTDESWGSLLCSFIRSPMLCAVFPAYVSAQSSVHLILLTTFLALLLVCGLNLHTMQFLDETRQKFRR